jgi:lysophospholipase L1-like esterase
LRWGSSLKPNATLLIEMPGPVGFRYDLVCTDARGVARNRVGPPQRLENAKTIAMLGGSTVMGTGSRLPEWTIPAQVERLLRDGGTPVNCMNFGVAGMTSRDSLAQLIDAVIPQKPDLVVLYSGWNCAFNYQLNAWLRASEGYADHGIHEGMGSRQMELGRLLAGSYGVRSNLARGLWLASNQLTSWLKSSLPIRSVGSVVDRLRQLDPTVNGRAIGELVTGLPGCQKALSDEAAETYLRVMRLAASVCSSEGIGFVGIFQPNLFWGAKVRTAEESQFVANEPVDPDSQIGFYQALKQCGLSDHVCDLSQTFAHESRQTYIDTGHLNPLGNQLMAEAISQYLQDLL